MDKKIHVISFQVPYPPNYGGVIDVYYKLQSLKAEGYYIILHTYIYHHEKYEKELLEWVDEINYYTRKTSLISQLSFIPYIVNSRKDKHLLKNLLKDKAPILFEGLHTCYFLKDKNLIDRIKIVRAHNIEHEYYKQLQRSTSSIWKKVFFGMESFRLKQFERNLKYASHIAAISLNEKKYFEKKYPTTPVSLLPCFFEQQGQTILPGKGNYILYQGNLSVDENIKAVTYLFENIIPALTDIHFVIAGANPNIKLIKLAHNLPQVQLIANPEKELLDQLIENAKINILLTFQNTGIKLKLLNALYKGAHCIVNTPMISGTGLENLCMIADSPSEIILLIKETLHKPYTQQEKLKREALLTALYSNQKNIKIITHIIDNLSSAK